MMIYLPVFRTMKMMKWKNKLKKINLNFLLFYYLFYIIIFQFICIIINSNIKFIIKLCLEKFSDIDYFFMKIDLVILFLK